MPTRLEEEGLPLGVVTSWHQGCRSIIWGRRGRHRGVSGSPRGTGPSGVWGQTEIPATSVLAKTGGAETEWSDAVSPRKLSQWISSEFSHQDIDASSFLPQEAFPVVGTGVSNPSILLLGWTPENFTAHHGAASGEECVIQSQKLETLSAVRAWVGKREGGETRRKKKTFAKISTSPKPSPCNWMFSQHLAFTVSETREPETTTRFPFFLANCEAFIWEETSSPSPLAPTCSFTLGFFSASQPTRILCAHIFLFSITTVLYEGICSLIWTDKTKDFQTCNTSTTAPGGIKGRKPTEHVLLCKTMGFCFKACSWGYPETDAIAIWPEWNTVARLK